MSRIRRYVRRHHVGLLALFVALGGTAYAGIQLDRNEVRSRNIAPGQVKRSDIGRNAVNSAKVANGSLRKGDFAPGQLPAGATGPTGPTGPPGLNSSASTYTADGIPTAPCNATVLRTQTVTLTEPSRILALAQAHVTRGADGHTSGLQLWVLEGTTDVALVPPHFELLDPGENLLTLAGLAKDAVSGATTTLGPGTYTLQLEGNNLGACSPGNITYAWTTLDRVILGPG